jgi:type VI secretion system protein ImpF
MALSPRDLPQTPSLLDRLLDDSPAQATEPDWAASYHIGRMKQSLARDLEVLLNTRKLLDGETEGYPRSADSLLNFGIMDLTSVSVHDSRSLRGLQDHLRKSIERFESRLGGVKISLEPGKEGPRSIRFRVDAVLRLQPGRPPVTFDATLQMGTNACTVQQR